MDYEKDIQIQKDELDLEWLRQPELISKYSKEFSKTQLELDKLNEKISVISAEKELDIRANPNKYGIEKVTEGALKTLLQADKELAGLRDLANEKKFEVNVLSGALKSLDNKKKALEKLVELYGQNYFSSPGVPFDISRGSNREKKKEIAMEKIKENIKRRTM